MINKIYMMMNGNFNNIGLGIAERQFQLVEGITEL